MSADCSDKPLLMAYLYGECDEAEREAFERHLAGCASCACELRELGVVRHTLQEWAPPETALNFRIVGDAPSTAATVTPFPSSRRRWTRVPAWVQLAAAVLVLAVGAAIANLDVTFANGGVTVRTGWRRPAQAANAEIGTRLEAMEQRLVSLTTASAPATTPGAGPVAANVSAPPTAPPTPSGQGLTAAETADLAKRMQGLIEASERKQQQVFENLLATRMVQFARDVDSQRRTDLVRIQQGLGQVDTRTMSEIAQMREMQRLLVNRVANIQEIK